MSFMTPREAGKTSCLVIENKPFGLRVGDQAVTQGSGSPRNRLSKGKQRVYSGNPQRHFSGRLGNEPRKWTEQKKCPRVERGPSRELALTSAQVGLVWVDRFLGYSQGPGFWIYDKEQPGVQ